MYICTQITTNKPNIMAHIDLNTITKEQFVEELLISDDAEPFFLPREQKLYSMDFDFEDMKREFEEWLAANCDNNY